MTSGVTFEYELFLNRSIDKTLTDTISHGQSGPGCDSKKKMLQTFQISRARVSSLDDV